MNQNFLTYSLIFLAVLILIVKYYWGKRKLFYHGSKFDGPIAWPLIGCLPTLILNCGKNFIDKMLKMPPKYKSPFRLYLGHTLYFCLTKPKDMEIVLNSPNALDKGGIYDIPKTIMGNGLLTAPVTLWKRNRKILSPAFSTKILSSYMQIFVEKSQNLADNLEDYANTGDFDVFPLIQKKSLEINCRTNLGEEQNGDDFTKNITTIFEIFAERVFNLFLHSDAIFEMTSLAKIMAKCSRDVNDFSEKAITKTKKSYKKNNNNNEDDDFRGKTLSKPFLEKLVEISMEGANLTNKQIIDEVNTLIMAVALKKQLTLTPNAYDKNFAPIKGSDSVASAVSFVLMMLGMHHDIQEKVYDEILGTNEPVEFEDLSKMKHLERTIKETLRLFPAAMLIMRDLTGDVHLDSGVLPKGSRTILFIMYTQRDPKIWSDPLKFDPDRFLPENFEKIPPYAYLPFSGGPRNCLGIKYAMFLMKTILATLLRRYKVDCHHKSVGEINLSVDILLKASDGYKISLEKRLP